MSGLAHKLRFLDYFALGWGTMVGVGWLVVMDDWLVRGGSLGAILGFALGGALLFPVGWAYGRLVAAIPDAAGEIAYTAAAFRRPVSFGTGWMMLLAYFIVCPWEAVAIGRVAGYIFPQLDTLPLYHVAGRPVFLPHLAAGLALTALLSVVNYRGIRISANFQDWTALGTLALFVLFSAAGFAKGSARNFPPFFAHAPVVSILLVLQVVPYFMTGFESIGKAAEEAGSGFESKGFLQAIFLALAVGIVFYVTVIAVVAFVSPWGELTGDKFLTAVAFQRAIGSRWVVSAILAAALLSLVKCFNGSFVAASRLLFALGRRRLIHGRAGHIHRQYQTPSFAVLCIGLATAICMLAGDAILVPVTEVGSVACAIGWAASCAALIQMGRNRALPTGPRHSVEITAETPAGLSTGGFLIAAAGLLVSIAMALMKVAPAVPGHFTRYEWLALAVWIALGLALVRRESAGESNLTTPHE